MNNIFTILVLGALMASPPALAGDPKASAPSAQDPQLEAELAQARERLEQAAREVARLSTMIGRGPMQRVAEYFHETGRKAMLGITIGGERMPGTGSGRGVHVDGISPGGPAEAAGLEAGDIVIAMNGESMSADAEEIPDLKLMKFMKNVRPGDTVRIRYLRDGTETEADVVPRAFDAQAFAFTFDEKFDDLLRFGGEGQVEKFTMMTGGDKGHHAGADSRRLEVVSLTPALGSYFGTEQGLLVVRTSGGDGFPLQDGDVILSVDGVAVDATGKAMQRLHKLDEGETASVQIVRQRQSLTVTVRGTAHEGQVMRRHIEKRVVDPDTGEVDVIIEND